MSPFTHPCAHCGLPLTFPENQQKVICIACGRTAVRPQSTGDCLNILQRAHRLRKARDYAPAVECYNHVLYQHENEHSALWGRVLCLYGVEYLQDDKTGEQHILVHFPHNRPFCEQSDFIAACELAPAEIRAQYEADARFIDEVQMNIRLAARKCPPYDIFLCFKDTGLNSKARTSDYYIAKSLYQQLSEKYRVFFSPITLKSAAGANYEATIYHALETAPLMIVVGTCAEHMTATWPQSEWSRFLEWCDGSHGEAGTRKRLIPLYSEMGRDELPMAFRLRTLQDIDWEQRGAANSLQETLDAFFADLKPDEAPPVTPPVPPAPPASTPPEQKSDKSSLLDKLFASPFQKKLRAAELGDAQAQNDLAWMYYHGKDVAQNYEQAAHWYRKAAEQGHAMAQYSLAYLHYSGKGVAQNYEQAAHWYRKAAEQGNATAQYNLGCFYDDGKGVPKNYAEALKWYRKSAEQGYAAAQNNLGWCYEKAKGVPQDYETAVKWYTRAAEQGHALAQSNLASCYELAKGVPQDYDKAFQLYGKAAQKGNVSGIYGLAYCYQKGYGTPVNHTESFRNYHLAAEKGNTSAMNQLGECYYYGRGVAKDYAQAFQWYAKAAEQGHVAANYNLGYCHEKGQGTPVNHEEAVRCYRLAAEKGNAAAQNNLGECYYYGRGVAENRTEAAKWYRKAADQNRAAAQYNLGYCYQYGKGVPKDLDEARRLYKAAADQGNKAAAEALKKL